MTRNLEQRVVIKTNIMYKITRTGTTKEGTKPALTSTGDDSHPLKLMIEVSTVVLACFYSSQKRG
jgi:hypothetical protein